MQLPDGRVLPVVLSTSRALAIGETVTVPMSEHGESQRGRLYVWRVVRLEGETCFMNYVGPGPSAEQERFRRNRAADSRAGASNREELVDRLRTTRGAEERREILAGASGRISFRQALRDFRHRPRFDRWGVALVGPGAEPYSRLVRFDDEEHARVQMFPRKRLAAAEARRRNKRQRRNGPERW